MKYLLASHLLWSHVLLGFLLLGIGYGPLILTSALEIVVSAGI